MYIHVFSFLLSIDDYHSAVYYVCFHTRSSFICLFVQIFPRTQYTYMYDVEHVQVIFHCRYMRVMKCSQLEVDIYLIKLIRDIFKN